MRKSFGLIKRAGAERGAGGLFTRFKEFFKFAAVQKITLPQRFLEFPETMLDPLKHSPNISF